MQQVNRVVAQLVKAGLLDESKRDNGDRPGPKARNLSLPVQAAYAVGLDLNHDEIRAQLVDLGFNVVGEARLADAVDLDNDADGAIQTAAEMVAELLHGQPTVQIDKVAGVGVSISAPYDAQRDRSVAREVLPGWAGREPATELSVAIHERLPVGRVRRLGVQAANDAAMGALAEHWLGAGRGFANFLYLRVSSGIGAGLVLHDRLYDGHTGIAGEAGHSHVDAAGPICPRCGNHPCLESVASAHRIRHLVREAQTARFRGREPTIEEIISAAENEQDPACRTALWDSGWHIGAALAPIINVLNPEAVVVGGDLRHARLDGDFYIAVNHAIERRVMPAICRDAQERRHELVLRAQRDGTLDGAAILGFAGLSSVLEQAVKGARRKAAAKKVTAGGHEGEDRRGEERASARR